MKCVSPAHRIEGADVVVGEGSRLRPDQRLQVVLMALEKFLVRNTCIQGIMWSPCGARGAGELRQVRRESSGTAATTCRHEFSPRLRSGHDYEDCGDLTRIYSCSLSLHYPHSNTRAIARA